MPSKKEVTSELGREIIMRRKVYPGLIQQQKLHPDHAKKQMERLCAALEVIGVMTDDEFSNLLKRHQESNQGGEVKQGALWT